MRTRHIFTQEEIATKFKNDDISDTIRSHRGNYEATKQKITHYRTTEAIRTDKGELIANTQCFADGFAKCSFFGGDCSLPLTTLEGALIDIHSIEVIDREHSPYIQTDHTVFKVKESAKGYDSNEHYGFRYFLFGYDEFRPFLTELPHEVSSVKEAIESLTPVDVRGKDVKRQGDLLFVKTNFTDDEVKITDYEHYAKYCKLTTYTPLSSDQQYNEYYKDIRRSTVGYLEKTAVWYIYDQNGDYERRRVQYFDGKHPLDNCMKHVAFRRILASEVVKEHHKPQIFDTNHKVNKIGSVNGFYTLVKGQVTHDRRQHRKLDLTNGWYLVYKNLAKQSWQVERRGGGGGD